MSKLNGVALSSIAAGSLLMWSGVKGWSLLATLGEVISGKKPSEPESVILTSGTSGSSGSAGIAAGGLAGLAVQYIGHAYLFGGAPGKDGTRPWDCSSFVNWLVSVKMGKAIPGYSAGKYDGSVHGPPTGSWGMWPGLQHISASQLQAGDLIVWTGHMGIAVSNTTMVSALDSRDGTKETPIKGFGNGPLMCYGRLS
jgi:hypothetical protein